MTYTSDPLNSVTDAIRLNIGDTDNDQLLFTDGELSYFYVQAGNSVTGASVTACYSLSARYSRLADEELGQAKVKWSQLSKAYALRAADYERIQAGGAGATKNPIPYAGGISNADIASKDSNTDRTQNVFDVGMMNGLA